LLELANFSFQAFQLPVGGYVAAAGELQQFRLLLFWRQRSQLGKVKLCHVAHTLFCAHGSAMAK